MSNPHLPAEILDHVVDHLHDTQDALRNCCLVSGSWIPRTRKHLFANVNFPTAKRLQSWKETFPEPSTSPAHYTSTLIIKCSHVVTAADTEADGWIRGFSRVVHLEVGTRRINLDLDLFVPFHGFSPAIKSLRVTVPVLPSLQIFNLISSFPRLENLGVIISCDDWTDNDGGSEEDEMLTAIQLSSPSMFTGLLELRLGGGTKSLTRGLSSLPGGIHFRAFAWTWSNGKDLPLMMMLAERCSHTLESLDITCDLIGGPGPVPIDLSKTTKLKDITFRCNSWYIVWIVTALRTITPNHRYLRQITVYLCRYRASADGSAIQTIGKRAVRGLWLCLDRLLVQLGQSYSICPRVTFVGQQRARDCIGCLLPEMTKRGIIDLVGC